MKHNCNYCNYSTTIQRDYDRHLLTDKHIKNVMKENKNVCEFCGKILGSKQAKYLHKKSCKFKPKEENEDGKWKELAEKQQKQIDSLIETNKNSSIATKESILVAKESAKTAGKSMNMMKYAMVNFKDAPPLLQLTEKQTCQLLEYEGATDKVTEREANEKYVRTMIYKYNDKILHKFFSKMIVSYIKTGDPRDCRVWAADSSRLSLIIMEQINTKGDTEWKNDKSGKRFASLVIHPVLNKASSMIDDFVTNQRDLSNPTSNFFIKEMPDSKRKQIMDETHTALVIKKQIKDDAHEKKILQYAVPYFNFNHFRSADKDFEFFDFETSQTEEKFEKPTKVKKTKKEIIKIESSESSSDFSNSESISQSTPIYKYSGKPPIDFRVTMREKRLQDESSEESVQKPAKFVKKIKK